MSQNEKLGIDIVVNLGDAQATLQKLTDLMNNLGKSPNEATDKLERLTAKFKLLAQSFAEFDPDTKGGLRKAALQIKAMMDEFGKADQIEKFGNRLRKAEQDMDSHVASFEKAQAAKVAALKKEDAEAESNFKAETIRQFKKIDQENKIQQTSLRAYSQYLDQKKRMDDVAAAAAQQAAWNAQAGTAGLKYKAAPGGGFVRSSVDTNATFSYSGGQAVPNSNAANEVARAAERMNAAFQGAHEGASGLNISLSKMFERLTEFYSMRTVILAVGNQLREAVSGALDFNQAIHDIAAISGESRDEMGRFGDSILNIATHSRYTAKEVSELMELLAQAGISAKDLPEVSTAVGMFATASASKPQEAADVYTTAANVFDIKAENSTRVTNALTAALNESKLTVQGLSTAFNYLAPQAAQLGRSLEETLGIIATMSQAGVKPSTIGTGVSQLMKEFLVPKKRLQTMLDAYGINPEEINPKLHSFAEIVDVLKNKGVETEHLFQSLESRVGRSIVAALNLGGDAFRNMTDSVTGTAAAAVAYEKAMEGANARTNVLKQEVQRLAVGLGEVFGPVASGVLTFLTDFVRGLQTTEGKAAIVISTLGLLANAMKALTVDGVLLSLSNPIFMAVAAVGALAAGFAYLGSQTTESAAQVKKSVDAHIQHAEVVQRTGDALRNATEEKKKYGNITDATKASLNKLKLEYPALLGNLDLEKISVAELTEVYKKLNAERVLDQKGKIAEFNNLAHIIETKKADQAEYLRVAEENGKHGTRVPSWIPGSADYFAGKLGQEIKDFQEQYDKLKGVLDFANMVRDRNGDWQYKQATVKPGKLVPPLPDANAGTGNAERKGENYSTHLEEANAKAEAEHRKNTIDFFKEELKDTSMEKELREAMIERVEELITEENELLKKKAVLAETKKLADAFSAAVGYDADENRYFYRDRPKDKKKAQVYDQQRADFADAYPGYKDLINNGIIPEFDSKNDKDLNAFAGSIAKQDNKPGALPKLTAPQLEKQMTFEMKAVQQRIDLRKQEAWTAAQVNQLDQELLEKTMSMGAMKIKNLENDNEEIEKWVTKTTWTEKNAAEFEKYAALHDENVDRIKEENLLLQAQGDQLRKLQDHSLTGNFQKGAQGVLQSATDTDKLTQQVGANITTTAIDGVTSSLDGMVTALANGENAWKSFRTGLGNMMKQIADELQKYILKMLVVYAVQKLIGVFTGSGGSGGGGAAMTSSTSAGTFTLGANGLSAARFAEGGPVPLNMGIPGQDSVPALLMPGEFVVPRNIVAKYGVKYFEDMKAEKFAAGGLVGAGSKTGASNGTSDKDNGDLTLNIINVVDPRTIPKTTGEEILNVMSYEAAKEGPTFKQWKAKIGNK